MNIELLISLSTKLFFRGELPLPPFLIQKCACLFLFSLLAKMLKSNAEQKKIHSSFIQLLIQI